MEVIHELLGYDRIKIIQNDEMFSFSIDAMLLADFVETNSKTKNIIDLGCGNGPIPLFLTLKTKANIVGIEIQEKVFDMAKRSVELNNLTPQIKIINDDIKSFSNKGYKNHFDIVVSNPPYFKYNSSSNVNKNDYLTIARHEVMINLEDIIKEGNKLLVDNGTFYMIHRAERLSEILNEFEKNNFGIKKIQFIYPKSTSNEALFVLIKAIKNKKSDIKVLHPLFLYKRDGQYSRIIKNIFNFKKNMI